MAGADQEAADEPPDPAPPPVSPDRVVAARRARYVHERPLWTDDYIGAPEDHRASYETPSKRLTYC